MKQVEVFILGCGKTARELIDRLDHHWRITVLDVVPERFEKLSPRPNVIGVHGDGTSEMVLRRAGAERARYGVACTTDDEANLAFCSLMRSRFRTPVVVSMAASLEAVEALEDLGADTVNRAAACAALIRNRIEKGIVEATMVGAGHGEIMEVRLHESSYYSGLTIGDLTQPQLRVAAVYRGDFLHLPEPDFTLLSGDRVLLVGSPSVLRGVAEAFLSGDLQFPLQYGSRVLLPLIPSMLPSAETLEEAIFIARTSRASGIDVVSFEGGRAESQARERILADIEARCEECGVGLHVAEPLPDVLQGLVACSADRKVGLIVLPDEEIGLYRKIFGISFTASVVNSVAVPVLISRGSHPWHEIVVPCQSTGEARRALEIAVDVSRIEQSKVVALRVYNRVFPSPGLGAGKGGPSRLELFLLDLAKLHKKEVEVEKLEGNPINVAIKRAEPEETLIMLESPGIDPRLILNPSVDFHIAHRARCSVMILPRGLAHGA